MERLGPRVVIAGTHSGVGKTTVATGLMAAFRRRGLVVASAKVGPDFIDPGYHAAATGRPARNLDSFMCSASSIVPLAAQAAAGSDLLIVEGVMGLFDGVGSTTSGSTAEIASLLEAPVVLVVDASSMSRSVAALVHGYHDTLYKLRGHGIDAIILNRVGSDNHLEILRESLDSLELPIVGALRRDQNFAWRDRHLGLVPVIEQPGEIARSIEHLSHELEKNVDLSQVQNLAKSASELHTPSIEPARRVSERPVPVAVLGGRAFAFSYPDNLERLRQAGAELLDVDPLIDRTLPDGARALYACGGFPETFAAELSDNQPLLDDVRRRVEGGLICWAECGGLLWLGRSLDGRKLCGALPTDATMSKRVKVGYRTAVARRDNPVSEAGNELKGHEHHYSTLGPPGDGLTMTGRGGSSDGGWASATMLASYLHMHLGSTPAPAERFVRTAAS